MSPKKNYNVGRQILQQKTVSFSKSGNSNRQSAVSKTASALRNKYNAMVSLKKLDLSPDKTKRFSLSQDSEETVVDETDKDLGGGDLEDTVSKHQEMEIEEESVATEKETGMEGSGSVLSESGKETGENIENVVKEDSKLTEADESVGEGENVKGIEKSKGVSSASIVDKLASKIQAMQDLESDEDMNNDPKSSFEMQNSEDVKEAGLEDNAKVLKTDSSEILETGTMHSEDNSIKDNVVTDAEAIQKCLPEKKIDEATVSKGNEIPAETTLAVRKDEESVEVESGIGKGLDGTEVTKTDLDLKSVVGLESKDTYRRKLDTMIQSCKEKLGVESPDVTVTESDENDDDKDDDSDSETESNEDDVDDEEEEDSSDVLEEGSGVSIDETSQDGPESSDQLTAQKVDEEDKAKKDDEKENEEASEEIEKNVSVEVVNDASESNSINVDLPADKIVNTKENFRNTDIKLNDKSNTRDEERNLEKDGTEVKKDTNMKDNGINCKEVDSLDSIDKGDKESMQQVSSDKSEVVIEEISKKREECSDGGKGVNDRINEKVERTAKPVDKSERLENAQKCTAKEKTSLDVRSRTSLTPTRTVLNPVSGEMMEIDETDDSDYERLVIDLENTPDRSTHGKKEKITPVAQKSGVTGRGAILTALGKGDRSKNGRKDDGETETSAAQIRDKTDNKQGSAKEPIAISTETVLDELTDSEKDKVTDESSRGRMQSDSVEHSMDLDDYEEEHR